MPNEKGAGGPDGGERRPVAADGDGAADGGTGLVAPGEKRSRSAIRSGFPAAPDSQPDRMCEQRQLKTTLARAMGCLPERYQKVVFLYYTNDLTMKEIGEVMGVNESRVSQIHKTALKKMAVALEAEGDPFGRGVLDLVEAVRDAEARRRGGNPISFGFSASPRLRVKFRSSSARPVACSGLNGRRRRLRNRRRRGCGRGGRSWRGSGGCRSRRGGRRGGAR